MLGRDKDAPDTENEPENGQENEEEKGNEFDLESEFITLLKTLTVYGDSHVVRDAARGILERAVGDVNAALGISYPEAPSDAPASVS